MRRRSREWRTASRNSRRAWRWTGRVARVFYANQFRVLLSAAAYALLQELWWRARKTRFVRTQTEGLRLFLLKLGVWVRSSTRRVVLSLPREGPYVSEWLQIARSLGAVPT